MEAPNPSNNEGGTTEDTKAPGISEMLDCDKSPLAMAQIPEKETEENGQPSATNGPPTQPADQPPWIPVTNNKPQLAQTKQNCLGVKVIRQGTRGSTAYNPKDLVILFEMIKRIDPQAYIMNHSAAISSATPVSQLSKLTKMDFRGFLDMRSTTWGKPADQQEITYLSFYLATDVVTLGLAELRDDLNIASWLAKGNCRIQPTQLKESLTRTLCYFQAKDPRHSYRQDLASRLSSHLYTNTPNKTKLASPPPVQVVQMNVTADGYTTRMCAAVVGDKDYQMALGTLKAKAFPDLDLLLNEWKRQHSKEFGLRLKQHDYLVSQSRAYKVTGLMPNSIQELRESLRQPDIQPMVLDLATTGHTPESGTAYIQYLQAHQQSVHDWINKFLQSHGPNSTKYATHPAPLPGPELASATSATSATMTVQSTGTRTTTMPPSRYKVSPDEMSKSSKITTFSRPSLPRSINAKVKSFSEALRSSSPTSSLGENTITTDNKSTKSAREVQLEAENAILKQEKDQLAQQLNQIQESQAQLKQQQDHMEAAKATEKARTRQLTDLVQELQQQVQALAAKLPPTPRKSKRHRKNIQQEADASDCSDQDSQMDDTDEEPEATDEYMEPATLELEDPSPSTGEGQAT